MITLTRVIAAARCLNDGPGKRGYICTTDNHADMRHPECAAAAVEEWMRVLAANPAVILDLLDELEAVKAELERIKNPPKCPHGHIIEDWMFCCDYDW